jgi:hypothetical protein
MKTLVIHPSDHTTRFLKTIYKDKGYTEITMDCPKGKLISQIKEHDRIIMLGHGTESGLIGFGRYIIDSKFVYLLRTKDVVCIWCNADVFVEKYKLKGIFTGMIISEYDEAILYSIRTTYKDLENSNIEFSVAMEQLLEDRITIDEAKTQYRKSASNEVVYFNSHRIYKNTTLII